MSLAGSDRRNSYGYNRLFPFVIGYEWITNWLTATYKSIKIGSAKKNTRYVRYIAPIGLYFKHIKTYLSRLINQSNSIIFSSFMKRIFTLAFSAILLLSFNYSQAQLLVTDSIDVNVLAQTLVGSGVTVSNATIDCPYDAYGIFDGVNSNIGMDDGIILSSGTVAPNIDIYGFSSPGATGPNNNGGFTGVTQDTSYAVWPGDSLLDVILPGFTTNNACVLEFDVTVGCADSVCFNYSFGSEEYLEWVGSSFNDVFGLFVTGMNPAGGVYNQENIAIVPGTNIPVAIDNVNDVTNPQFFVDNGDGNSAPQNTDSTVVQYDGFTVVLPACFAVVPYETYRLKIAVADAGDAALDSGVFLQAQSLSANTVAISSNATVQGFDNAVAGCVDGEFEFNISPSMDDLTIYLDYLGSAVDGVDYVAGPDSIIIPAGYTVANLFIDVLDPGVLDGNDTLVLIVDAGACGISDTAILVIEDAPIISVGGGGLICNGDSAQINASGALSYSWAPADGLSSVTDANPMASPDVTTEYEVTMTYGDCIYMESVLVEVCPPCPTLIEIGTSANEACDGEIVDINYTLDDLTTPATITWSGPFTIDEANGTVIVENTSCAPFDAEFIVTAVCDQDPNVVLTDTTVITVYPSDISSFVTANESDCAVSLTVDPNCTDWISVDDAPEINAGDEGSADLTAYYDPSNCAADVTYTLSYDCPLCEISNFSVTMLECNGTSYMMQVDITAVDNATDFILYQDGTAIGTYAYADAPIMIGPFPGDGTAYNFSAEDTADANCTSDSAVAGQFCYLCDIDNVVLSGVCTSIDGFDLSLSFTGSNVYTITDGTTVWNNISAGSDIYLGNYPENIDVIITITDELASDCAYVADGYSIDCDCASEPGTIMVNSMNVCPDDLSIVDADDFLLEPGQSVYYLYHDQPTVDNSDLPDLSSEVYTTGSFLTNNGATIPCGQTVYVTAIGAYEDLSMPGFPDYADFCLTVSNTIPVNFLCPITITVDEICNTEFGEFTYTFMLDGGLPAVIAGETYDVTGDNFNGMGIGLAEMVSVGPMTDLSSYTITATDANGCSSTITQQVECEKVPIELISFSGTAKPTGNLLEWITASEIENDYFTLLSSKDGITFTAIAQIDGAGTVSTEMRYSSLDSEAADGITYYQLQQTDYDGSTSLSSVISVERVSDVQLISEVYPVPADKFVGFIFNAQNASDVVLNISDVSGKVLRQQTVNVTIGRNDIQLDIESLSTGIYFISLDSETMSQAQKFVKE